MSQCANIGPADYNYDETISTLRYANRAKNIKNKARINEDPKDALLRQFQKEIEELKKKLEEGEIPLLPFSIPMLILFEHEHSSQFEDVSNEFGSWCRSVSWLCLPCSVPGVVPQGQQGAGGGPALSSRWHLALG